MAISKGGLCLIICVTIGLIHLAGTGKAEAAKHHWPRLHRSSFPAGFMFGAGSSSYQVEGAAFLDGKGPSIWDTFTHQHPEKIADHNNADVADDMYHRYKEDIALMKRTGLDAYRFSISWPRLLPKGKISGGVNPLGVQFYNKLIDTVLANGLKPYVTLFHWDLPQALYDEYGGFMSDRIVDDYLDYADFCFKTFGDRVKHWFTLNEPYSFTVNGYDTGIDAPGRCSSYIRNCTAGGNSATEPYIVAHHSILSHAFAVKLYREKYKPIQKGRIGITLVTQWFEPLTHARRDQKAAQRAIDFMLGWFLDPITYGGYPQTMKSLVGNRLPKFTKEQSDILVKSYDFLGINYYSANYAAETQPSSLLNQSYTTDNHVNLTTVRNGIPIGKPTVLKWLFIYPRGIRSVILYIQYKYGNPPIYITENGVAEANNNSTPPTKEALKDDVRIVYHSSHLAYLLDSIKKGANVKGYFMWTILDNFEWAEGFTVRFGMFYVDFKDGLKRYPKYSAFWFKNFLRL